MLATEIATARDTIATYDAIETPSAGENATFAAAASTGWAAALDALEAVKNQMQNALASMANGDHESAKAALRAMAPCSEVV